MTKKTITIEDVRAAAAAWVKSERELEACDAIRRERIGDLEQAVDDTSSEFDRLLGLFREQQVERAREATASAALEIITRYGGIDGSHHKQWVLDQVARALAGDSYETWLAEYRDGEDGPETYQWSEGIAP